VTGVDMTDEQLEIANRHVEYHREKFGYQQANTRFLNGYIEKLDALNIADNSIDVVISNCVINLSPDKHAILREVFRILKPGGEIYFSDVYADKRVPAHLKEDPLLYGECLSGALYWNDFENLAKSVGFVEPRLVSNRAITIDNNELAKRLGDVKFISATYRMFKAQNLETDAQDYGQRVTYIGSIDGNETQWQFDSNTLFKRQETVSVSGNTWRTLAQSRFAEHFLFHGDFDKHLGLFTGSDKSFDFVDDNVTTSSSGCCAPTPKAKPSCCE